MRFTLPKYAEVRAVLRYVGPAARERALFAMNIGSEEWRVADMHWRRQIDQDIESGEGDCALSFDEVFQSTRSLLEQHPVAVEDLRTLGLGFESGAPPVSPLTPPAPPPPASAAITCVVLWWRARPHPRRPGPLATALILGAANIQLTAVLAWMFTFSTPAQYVAAFACFAQFVPFTPSLLASGPGEPLP